MSCHDLVDFEAFSNICTNNNNNVEDTCDIEIIDYQDDNFYLLQYTACYNQLIDNPEIIENLQLKTNPATKKFLSEGCSQNEAYAKTLMIIMTLLLSIFKK